MCVCAHVCTCVYVCVCGVCHKSICMQVPMGVDVCICVYLPANARGKCFTLPSDAICIFETGFLLDVDHINLTRLSGQLILGIMCPLLFSAGIAIVQQHKGSKERTRVFFIDPETLY